MSLINDRDAEALAEIGLANRRRAYLDRTNPNRTVVLEVEDDPASVGDVLIGLLMPDGAGRAYLGCLECQQEITLVDASICRECRRDLAFEEARHQLG